MKVETLPLSHLPNQEHFQFMTAIRKVVFPQAGDLSPTQGTLHVEVSVLTPFKQSFTEKLSEEDIVLIIILKSALTGTISAGDVRRDNAIVAFNYLLKMYAMSPNEEEREAARVLQIVVDTYGKFYTGNYNKQTASTHNFLQDIETRADAVATLNAQRWLDEIRESNIEFDRLVHQRYDEKSLKPADDIKQIRREIDAIYKKMMNMLEIVDTISPSNENTALINRINEVVANFRDTMAIRKGVAKAQKEKEEAKKQENE